MKINILYYSLLAVLVIGGSNLGRASSGTSFKTHHSTKYRVEKLNQPKSRCTSYTETTTTTTKKGLIKQRTKKMKSCS